LIGYVLRKLDFELAPIILGLVLAPMLELSFRQSLAMSAGSYAVFITRPIAAVMLAVAFTLLLLGLTSRFRRGASASAM
jgi:putative tricarboxylic transport membrane protein